MGDGLLSTLLLCARCSLVEAGDSFRFQCKTDHRASLLFVKLNDTKCCLRRDPESMLENRAVR